ncbi:MAG: von Willebrand factor type A domain-containing protein, partial [Bacteroidota bacterium]
FVSGLGWTTYHSSFVVKGYVRDAATKEPLIGATVLVKGTSNGALTDVNGFYQLTIPEEQKNAVLLVNFVGFRQQEVAIKGHNQTNSYNRIDINLQPDIVSLDEVVVTSATRTQVKRAKREKRRRDTKVLNAAPAQPQVSMDHETDAPTSAPIQQRFATPPPPPPASISEPKVRIKPQQAPQQQPANAPSDEGWRKIDHTFSDGQPKEDFNREGYSPIVENQFLAVMDQPLSTFSIDVDRASYANMRRFLNSNQMPPKDAVRIEEMVNYFHYDYKDPETAHPFNIITEMSACPWAPDHHLLHVALKGKEISMEEAPASNLVFLIDVSGSMSSYNKLPLLKQSLNLLVQNLRSEDRVAIVVYAGAAGEVLPSTAGDRKNEILNALNRLQSGGSTAGGAGIKLAYRIARQNFIPNGNNRVILATDGDFNVGESSDAAMQELIEKKREEGVFLTVLGFGTGNYQDAKMEILAD